MGLVAKQAAAITLSLGSLGGMEYPSMAEEVSISVLILVEHDKEQFKDFYFSFLSFQKKKFCVTSFVGIHIYDY